MNNTKNVLNYYFGSGALSEIQELVSRKKKNKEEYCIYFIDSFFNKSSNISILPLSDDDLIYFINTIYEPSTDSINKIKSDILQKKGRNPCAIIGMGGGCTLDTAKAISNLLTNDGKAEDYQGWDLVKNPGIYKIGLPTISGTGAETSRTCVLMNKKKNLKLGMNSEYTIFDQLILDPDLTRTVPRNQYYYTGMDTYIHCIESLNGNFRHPIADAYSREALRLCREVFGGSEDMMSDTNREKLMVASFLGGQAIANTYVGIVHPISAALSVVLDIHHGIGNCLALNVLEEFYPYEVKEFKDFIKINKIELPQGITKHLNDTDFERLYQATIIHDKPLGNALGPNYYNILNREKIYSIFKKI